MDSNKPNDIKGLPVLGYRDQNEENLDLVNTNKQLEEVILTRLDLLAQLEDIDKRWLALGRTQIEQGFMAINRAIFKPGRVQIDVGD
ncbi:hypothetical protein G6M16_007040 [Agrobacterium tumefaciens]|nr:hypothetical protein G6M16_007040 [Agrobacterium tumefaciens]